MSKNINVSPDHYKVAGRERQGENIPHNVVRQQARSKASPQELRAAERVKKAMQAKQK